jgi:hypothetical protein
MSYTSASMSVGSGPPSTTPSASSSNIYLPSLSDLPVVSRGFGFTPILTDQDQDHPLPISRSSSDRRRRSGEEESAVSKRARSSNRSHPYLDRILIRPPNSRSDSYHQEPTSASTSHTGHSTTVEPESPSAITAASLLSLASSSNQTYMPVSSSSGSHTSTPPVSSIPRSYPLTVPGQQPPHPSQMTADPYLVDFDPFSATGWATLEQVPFSQQHQQHNMYSGHNT